MSSIDDDDDIFYASSLISSLFFIVLGLKNQNQAQAPSLCIHRGNTCGSSESKLYVGCIVLFVLEPTWELIRDLKKRSGLDRYTLSPVKDETEILLAISVASDDMIRSVHMFPEEFYMDVTANTNKQKRDLFLILETQNYKK